MICLGWIYWQVSVHMHHVDDDHMLRFICMYGISFNLRMWIELLILLRLQCIHVVFFSCSRTGGTEGGQCSFSTYPLDYNEGSEEKKSYRPKWPVQSRKLKAENSRRDTIRDLYPAKLVLDQFRQERHCIVLPTYILSSERALQCSFPIDLVPCSQEPLIHYIIGRRTDNTLSTTPVNDLCQWLLSMTRINYLCQALRGDLCRPLTTRFGFSIINDHLTLSFRFRCLKCYLRRLWSRWKH